MVSVVLAFVALLLHAPQTGAVPVAQHHDLVAERSDEATSGDKTASLASAVYNEASFDEDESEEHEESEDESSPSKPHIVLMLADDFGHANFGPTARKGDSELVKAAAQTPFMDKLVDEGVLLNRHYAYRICSPSRCSLQSGRIATHVNMFNTGVTVANASDPISGAVGIPTDMTTMATPLKEAGYRTHGVGKWDVGMATPNRVPQGRGYETWYGYYQHANDFWTKGVPLDSVGEVDNCAAWFTDFFEVNETYSGGCPNREEVASDCDRTVQDPICYEETSFKRRVLRIINEVRQRAAEWPRALHDALCPLCECVLTPSLALCARAVSAARHLAARAPAVPILLVAPRPLSDASPAVVSGQGRRLTQCTRSPLNESGVASSLTLSTICVHSSHSATVLCTG